MYFIDLDKVQMRVIKQKSEINYKLRDIDILQKK